MKMEKEIKKIIEQNLPKQVGENLQEVLRQGKEDAKRVKELEKTVESLQKQSKNDKDLILFLEEKVEKHKNLTEWENSLISTAKQQETEILKIKLEEANKRGETVEGFVGSLMRNTEFRRSIYDNKHSPGYTAENGNWVSDKTETKNTEIIDTKE